jgi:hypothetical protein
MTKKRLSLILGFVTLLALIPSLRAQAVYTAERTARIQAGAGVNIISPDYTNKNTEGVSIWGDYDFNKWVGAEVGAHFSFITPDDWSETSYMVGPRGMYHFRKFTGYGKLLVGRATLTPQEELVTADHLQSSSYNAYAFGGGLEYRVTRKINIRAVDFEIQKWPNFEPHTLSPMILTFGAAYIIK